MIIQPPSSNAKTSGDPKSCAEPLTTDIRAECGIGLEMRDRRPGLRHRPSKTGVNALVAPSGLRFAGYDTRGCRISAAAARTAFTMFW
jgi:hypothetical protein